MNGKQGVLCTKGGCLTHFLSLLVLSLLACHGGKGREKGDKREKKRQKVNLFGKVQVDRPHLGDLSETSLRLL